MDGRIDGSLKAEQIFEIKENFQNNKNSIWNLELWK